MNRFHHVVSFDLNFLQCQSIHQNVFAQMLRQYVSPQLQRDLPASRRDRSLQFFLDSCKELIFDIDEWVDQATTRRLLVKVEQVMDWKDPSVVVFF